MRSPDSHRDFADSAGARPDTPPIPAGRRGNFGRIAIRPYLTPHPLLRIVNRHRHYFSNRLQGLRINVAQIVFHGVVE